MSFESLIPAGTYLATGPEFGRIAQWLRHFDVEFYRTFPHDHGHADLMHLDERALVKHFIETGWTEGRPYSRFIYSFLDPEFYIQRYPELGLMSLAEAGNHWMFEGFYEGRVPNAPMQSILDSEIHLFQFGKVGSKTIEKALLDAGHDQLVVHLHWPSDMLMTYPYCLLSYEEVVRREPRKLLKFITGVRDPISRLVSAHFQSQVSNVDLSELTVEDIVESMTYTYFSLGQIDFVLDWFDHQFFRGIDVFDIEFDVETGYTIIERDDTRVFLYRVENLSCLKDPLSRFVDLPIKLASVNRSEDKSYRELYGRVVELLKIPPRDLERVLTSKLVRHFYSPSEIDRMYDRWVSR
jgi:hypothetical protein